MVLKDSYRIDNANHWRPKKIQIIEVLNYILRDYVKK